MPGTAFPTAAQEPHKNSLGEGDYHGLQSLNPMGNPFLQAELTLIAFLLQHLEGLGPEVSHPLFMDLRLWCYIVVVISIQGLWERRD